MKETLFLERTVSLLQWAQTTPGVNLQLLNYAEVTNNREGRTGACMSEMHVIVHHMHMMGLVHLLNLHSDIHVPSSRSCCGNPTAWSTH